MTFSCKNFLEAENRCGKLGGECVPGRKGCVLGGEFKLSSALAEKVLELDGEQDSGSGSGQNKP